MLKVDENTYLKLPQLKDAPALFSLTEKNRAYLREFLSWLDFTLTVEDTEMFLRLQAEKMERKEAFSFVIWHQDKLVGLVGCTEIFSLRKCANIGYWIDQDHQGKGIMKKSVQALMTYAFEELGLHRLEILCAVHNVKSQKIPKSLGFEKEGTLKEAIWHYDEYFDCYLYGKCSN